MMAGFGGKTSKKPKEKPAVVGAGRGQKIYERQMRSFTGLAGAGAEIVDVYVYEQNSDDDKFIFAGKVAWSSEVTVEQALQVSRLGLCFKKNLDWSLVRVGFPCGVYASQALVEH